MEVAGGWCVRSCVGNGGCVEGGGGMGRSGYYHAQLRDRRVLHLAVVVVEFAGSAPDKDPHGAVTRRIEQ